MESGQVIAGKYRLNNLLGQGGMASVWSATNTFTERQFAVKFMLASLARTDDAVQRFLQEAKVSARINHPNIIEIIDVGQAEDTSLFLVMELLSGVTLETAMRRQSPAMTLSEMAFVMVEVARALAAAHQNGVIHRDLKPSNIFLHKERDGRAVPKVLDFGVSKFLEEEGGRLHSRTVAGTVLGSPLYMSPEQARGESRVDGRSDIFSFGALLFEAVVGQRPYDGANFNALIVRIATQPPKDINLFADHAPAGLRALIKDCLEPNVNNRLASFDEVAARLMEVLPELEAGQLRVPAPDSGSLSNDPDATNALPVVRPSDKPPAHAPQYNSFPPPPFVPTGLVAGHTPGSGTPALSEAAPPQPSLYPTLYPSGTAAPAWRNPTAIALSALVALVVLGLGALLVFASDRSHVDSTYVQTTPTVVRTTERTATATASATVTVVRPDSLPMASSKPGYVSFVSTPVNCLLIIDGQQRGMTPTGQLELTSGPHRIECRSTKGESEVRNVNVFGGATDRHLFTFDHK